MLVGGDTGPTEQAVFTQASGHQPCWGASGKTRPHGRPLCPSIPTLEIRRPWRGEDVLLKTNS